MNHEFIIDAWRFDEDSPRNIRQTPQWGHNCWFHCQRDVAGLRQWLQSIGLGVGIVSALLAEDTRPRFQQIDANSFLLILRGVNLNKGERPDDMLSLRILYYQGSLITLRKFPFRAIAEIRERLQEGTGPSTINEVLLSIIERLHGRIEEVLEESETTIDELQDNLERLSATQQRQLTQLHRQMLKLSRFLKPQTQALQEFINGQMAPVTTGHLSQQFLNQKDIVLRILEDIEGHIGQLSILRDHMQQAAAERMNRNTYRLSLFAGVFLPLGFLTGLLGVNLGGIPGADERWAFAMLCAGLAVLGIGEFLLLRRFRFW